MEGRDEGWKPYVLKIAVLAGAYYGAAKLGLNLAFASPSVTAIWAPTGISLAAVLLWGYRVWPGVALGALLANAWTGVPLYAVLGITAGNTLEALAGAYLLRELADFRASLERVRDVLALAILGGVVSTTISATIGVTSLLVANEIASANFGSVWRTWWLGDMGGNLLVAPAILVAVTHWPYRRAPGRIPEAVALAATALAVTAFVFSHHTALIFILFPLGVWAALRFWQPGTVVGILLVASVAIPLTEADKGPFSGESPDDRLLLAQGFLGIASITMLVMSAVITERRRAEEAVKSIAGTLQESLFPSHLPVIPGIEAAVDFRAAGRRHLVGGDFYDLFPRDDESWAVIVGDVLGKGATAAATAGLARYTLRAAAVQESQPSRILRLLNDAILRQSPDQSCTVACGRIDLNSADGARSHPDPAIGGARSHPDPAIGGARSHPDPAIGGARVTLSVGGHPLPLVLRANGRVEQVGHPGTMLGVLPHPELADHTADLAPGDALILYTDGLTDAYAPGRIVKRTGLVAALASCAGQGATEIASGLHEAALGGAGNAEPRDDIVLLVLRVPEHRTAPPNPP